MTVPRYYSKLCSRVPTVYDDEDCEFSGVSLVLSGTLFSRGKPLTLWWIQPRPLDTVGSGKRNTSTGTTGTEYLRKNFCVRLNWVENGNQGVTPSSFVADVRLPWYLVRWYLQSSVSDIG